MSLLVLKVTWTVFVFGCTLVNLFTLKEAYIDKLWVDRQTKNPANHIRAWQSFRDELVTFVFQAVLLVIRFWAIFWPPPENALFRYNWAVDATTITALQCLIAINCILDLRDRRRTINAINQSS